MKTSECNGPKRESQVAKAIMELSTVANGLNTKIESLENQLDQVLIHEEEVLKCNREDSADEVDLANTINSIVFNLKELGLRKVDSILSRLEL